MGRLLALLISRRNQAIRNRNVDAASLSVGLDRRSTATATATTRRLGATLVTATTLGITARCGTRDWIWLIDAGNHRRSARGQTAQVDVNANRRAVFLLVRRSALPVQTESGNDGVVDTPSGRPMPYATEK